MLSLASNSKPGGLGHSPWQGGPVIPPGTKSLFVAVRDSHGYLEHPHIGTNIKTSGSYGYHSFKMFKADYMLNYK
jgi:hypothetical protein